MVYNTSEYILSVSLLLFQLLDKLWSQVSSLLPPGTCLQFLSLLDVVEAEVPLQPRRTPKLGWCEMAETSAAFTIAWNAREDARRFMRINPRDSRVEDAEDGVCDCER